MGDRRRAKKNKAAARYRAAAFLLVLGIALPSLLPHSRLKIPAEVGALLAETLAEEDDPARIAYVRTACGAVGQVGYFWGGKSHTLGWDPAWGWPRRVTAPGSDTTGRLRPWGLDCSGLTAWAAAVSSERAEAYDLVGEGVREQYARCAPTEEPRSGDLAFFPDLSHVGIVLGRDGEGELWVVHCSASLGGVVVSRASVGFACYGTPPIFGEGQSRMRTIWISSR